MSAQQRYRTVVQNIGRIYAAPENERTELLQSALAEIMDVIAPKTQSQWSVVSADSDRLLKVWLAKEKDEAAGAVVTQLSDMLRELREVVAVADAVTVAVPAVKKEPVAPAPVLCMEPADKIVHVPAMHSVVVVNPEPVPTHPLYACIQKPAAAAATVAVEEEEVVEEEVEEEVVEEEVEEEVVEEEAEDQSTQPPEAAAEEEEVVVEAEEEVAEEEEEVGLEVEQMTWRGRNYWRDVNTNKIYAIVDEDDVGDEIGELVNGKPAFYAK